MAIWESYCRHFKPVKCFFEPPKAISSEILKSSIPLLRSQKFWNKTPKRAQRQKITACLASSSQFSGSTTVFPLFGKREPEKSAKVRKSKKGGKFCIFKIQYVHKHWLFSCLPSFQAYLDSYSEGSIWALNTKANQEWPRLA